ncbi:YqjF family protein [Mycobacterium sp. 050134]|uniref:YqjF family protein n=1 Tax=Mycobacterium sp. 050134 TaxID=3096111 RepID=UPI002ED86D93
MTGAAPIDPGGESALGGYPLTAPPLLGPVTFDQRWCDVTFVHWPVRPESVGGLFPPGTRPDVFAGATYVGLVPFAMRSTKVGSGVDIPYFGSFLETNVRLYSIDGAGRHGVLFRSLETARLAVVPAIRLTLGVPYTWAKMRMTRDGDRLTYRSVRRWPHRGLRSHLTVTVGEPVAPTPLEVWLTARWGAHTRKAGRTWWVPNEHDPWPLRAAEIVELSDELVGAAGAHPAGERLRALHSSEMRTRFGRPRVVR